MLRLIQKRHIAIYSIWVLAALFTSTQLYLKTLDAGNGDGWLKLFLIQLLVWSVWGGLSPIIFWLGKRYRIDKQTYYSGLALHLLFAVALVLLYLAIYSLLWNFLGIGTIRWETFKLYFKIFFLNLFHWHFFIYMAIIGIAHAMDYRNEAEIRRREADRLEKQLLRSELNTLKAQLSPHFLFNTINNVVGTIEQGRNKVASGMLIRLGSFLRMTLEESQHDLIPLKTEIEYIQQYLEIERFRNKDLEVVIHGPLGESECLVPNFILQPLVENAIKHGISKEKEAKRIEIGMDKLGEKLKLWVYNEGPPFKRQKEHENGIGIGSTISRLESVYQGQASFELLNANAGVVAELLLPINLKGS
ncbi:sensor histidine kinase [Flagellimonas flava]|uniref:Histidine kinase n=1 Tax=Flagellimonas flava TaxID=570519 RepID=A0A1M5PX18_9FLAO|nr:histidine kinase [Allomuricauda flava]SHH06210.1 Histidine kinase [Allomuricauda flava]